MRTLQFAVTCVVLLAAGCRSDNSTVLLERDLRMQEDKIYQLQACLEDAQAAREATIRENESLKQEIGGGDKGAGPPIGSPSSPDADLTAPSVELPGGGTSPASPGPKRNEKPDLTPPSIELPQSGGSPGVEAPPGGQTMVESPPTQLVINKRLTGGLDRDGHNGDEGLLVVFEPRDAAGHLVKWPGKVSVVAMDPTQEGEAARVARWDFSADEVTGHLLNTVFGRGLQFELPWPSAPPRSRELQLFVRFTTDDGQKLNAETKIEVRPPSDAPPGDRQTKRAPRSRVKGRSGDSEAPRATRSPAKTDSAEFSAEDEDVTNGHEELPLQATRPNRPEWKPFR